jgi:hypothetical protein
MALTGNSCFWLVHFYKSSILKQLSQVDRNLVGCIYGSLWRTCLLTDQNGMSNSHRRPSIDVSYHVSVHLAKLFQSRRFLEIDQSETRMVCDEIFFSETALPKWTDIWWEAPMEGSVLSFLKAEWKVSDTATGSAHWASSYCLTTIDCWLYTMYVPCNFILFEIHRRRFF